MEQTRYANLPVIGRIQHGEKINNKVTELHHFIAKIEDSNMQKYLDAFDRLYKGKTYVDIEVFNDKPMSIKYARFNQSGEVCHCMVDSNKGSTKTKEGWKEINCDTYNCKYRQRNEYGKMSCNRIAWLKFLIPSICNNRIFLMRITGQTSIDRLESFFSFRKYRGEPVKGKYRLFLKDVVQEDFLGKSHTNKILDIIELENSNSLNINLEESTNTKIKPTESIKNVDNSAKKLEESTTKKATKRTTKKTKTEKTSDLSNESKAKLSDDFSNFYIYASSKKQKIKLADGTEKEYLIGEFYDVKNNIRKIAIKPEDENIVINSKEYETYILDIKAVGNLEFAVNLEVYDEQKYMVA